MPLETDFGAFVGMIWVHRSKMLIIEDHTENGVVWGVSVDGPNPTAEQFVKCRDKAHAEQVKRAFNKGILSPWLEAAGALVKE